MQWFLKCRALKDETCLGSNFPQLYSNPCYKRYFMLYAAEINWIQNFPIQNLTSKHIFVHKDAYLHIHVI